MEHDVAVAARIDGKTFSQFALFDTLRLKKRWLRPALFAVIFTAFSLLAFSRRGASEGAGLLGGVLLAVGLGLPLVYLGSFFLSVRRQAKRLKPNAAAYTLTLNDAGLSVRQGKDAQFIPWDALYAVHRLPRCLCLYRDAQHAFLLPKSSGAAFDRAWDIVNRRVEKGKVHEHGR